MNKPQSNATEKSRPKLAILCPPGWSTFLIDIVAHLQTNYDLRTCYTDSGPEITEAVNWADIVWIEWANEMAVEVTNKLTVLDDKRVICRLHSYEVFDGFLNQVNWSRVDDLIFVANHIKEHAVGRMSDLDQKVKRIHVVPNCIDPDKYPLTKRSRGYNLAFVGNVNYKKGPMLLLQAMARLVERDPKYKIHIAGNTQDVRYTLYYTQMVLEMGLERNIVFDGWVDDIAEWLQDKQYIVSSSLLESQGMGILEGMLRGLKPVIHNFVGARDLYDSKYLWTTIDEFVQMVTSDDYDSTEYHDFVRTRYPLQKQLDLIEDLLMINYRDKKAANSKVISGTINFAQPLEPGIEVVDNRKAFTIEYCRGKRVLHVGCVDAGIMEQRIEEKNFLHYYIDQVATKLIGVDIDRPGLDHLSKAGYDVHYLDLQTDRQLLTDLAAQVDLIVIPEVIEHLNNVGQALDNLRESGFTGDILFTTPNAFSYRTTLMLAQGVEMVHPDHNYYFSATTLKAVMDKHGFEIKRLLLYYWPTDDELGRQMTAILKSCPYYGEGLIAITRVRNS